MTVLHIKLLFMILEEKKIEIRVKIFHNNHSNWVITKLRNRGLKIKKNRIEH